MSRKKGKNKPVEQSTTPKTRKPFNKTMWMKVFSILLLLMLFLVPTLSLLINRIAPQPVISSTPTQTIQVQN
jgi:flagellar biogenesis protein FliO